MSKQRLTAIIVAFVWIFLSLRLLHFISEYSVNLLYLDQWDIADLILNNDFIEIFNYQHNEHRIGVGMVLIKALALLTHWNTRAESFMVGLLLICISLIALAIKQRLTNKLSIFDVSIPPIFLNVYQTENLIWGFQVTFILPLVFLFLSVYLFTFRQSLKRDILLITTAFLGAYSSLHGLFVSGFTGVFFLYEGVLYKSSMWGLIRFIIISLIMVNYFINFNFGVFSDRSTVSFNLFLQFVSLLLTKFFGISNNYAAIILLIIIVVGIIWVGVIVNRKLLNFNLRYTIFVCCTYTILFMLAVFIGRNRLGLTELLTTRYLSHLIPMFVAIYYSAWFIYKQQMQKLFYR